MQFFEYNEKKQRGSIDFPIDYHYVDMTHPQYHMPLHWHEEYEIIHILQGTFLISLNGKEFTLTKGMVCFISDGILHGGTPVFSSLHEPCIYECVVFHMDLLRNRGFASDIFLRKLVHHQITLLPVITCSEATIQFLVSQLFETMKVQPDGYELCTCSSLLGLFGQMEKLHNYTEITDTYYPSSQKTEQLKKALELIESSYDTSLTLSQLSKACGLSPKYFCRFFKEMTHTTVMNYLNQYRIEQASHLISTKELSLLDVSLSCGFNDFSYFIRTFKKYKGITPKQYALEQR